MAQCLIDSYSYYFIQRNGNVGFLQISMEFEGGKGDGGSAKKQLQDWATDLIKNLPDGKILVTK